MSVLLPLGYEGAQPGAAASETVRGAVAMAMRAARAHMPIVYLNYTYYIIVLKDAYGC